MNAEKGFAEGLRSWNAFNLKEALRYCIALQLKQEKERTLDISGLDTATRARLYAQELERRNDEGRSSD